MRRAALLLVAVCAAALAPLAGADVIDDDGNDGRSGHDSVWVVNRDRGELTIFDAASGTPVATVPTGAGAHEVAISRRSRQAYVTNELEDSVSIVSTKTLAARKAGLGPRPHHAEPSRDGRTIVVGLVGSNQIATIDAETGLSREYVSSRNPEARAHSGYVSRDGETIFVPHETGNEVTAVDALTGAIELSVGGIVQASEVLPDRKERLLYVSARGEGKVKVIDLASGVVVGEVAVGTQPEGLLLADDGRTLIVSLRGSPAQLAFVDTESLTLVSTVALGEAGTFGDLEAMSADGRLVYATFDRGVNGVGGVAVVDIRRRSLLATWAYPGTGRPHGIAISTRRLR